MVNLDTVIYVVVQLLPQYGQLYWGFNTHNPAITLPCPKGSAAIWQQKKGLLRTSQITNQP